MAETIYRPQTRIEPRIPASDPRFKWTSGADVQATWRRLTGWTPPSASRTQFFDEPVRQPAHLIYRVR